MKVKIFSNIVLLLLLTSWNFSSNYFAQSTTEATIENILSVYVYNFTKFIEWPQNNDDDFHICVLGESNFIKPLSTIAQKEKVNGRDIVVNQIKDINAMSECEILFMPNGNDERLNKVLDKIKGKSTLLITNTQGFAEKGAGINFVRINDKVKFEINKKVLEENKIIPNSRLLSLAVKVYN